MPDYDEMAERMQQQLDEKHGFLSWLDVRVADVSAGRVVVTIPFDEKLTNVGEPPTIQGGVAATLVDVAGGLALRTDIEDAGSRQGVATISLNVNYLRRAAGDLRATGEIVRAGDSVGVADVVVESENGGNSVEVATGQPTFRLFR